MAPYSNGRSRGYSYGYEPPRASSYDHRSQSNHADIESICEDLLSTARRYARRAWAYFTGQEARHLSWNLALLSASQLKRNLTRHRLMSFPHLLFLAWVVVLLWGERWIFASRVQNCDWDQWEQWPEGAQPHRLVFVADPQITDPHSYPGRPWPADPITFRITDNYVQRSYTQIQKVLQPDTVFFLGDLFDGGREWKTWKGSFDDPEYLHRPPEEKKLVGRWYKKYNDAYWMKEYDRFGRLFYDTWKLGGWTPGPGQRGRKLISGLPGNHDYGFGSGVKIPARHRFVAYFGETNRVDIIGNHTFVSVDTVSLSADTAGIPGNYKVDDIYGPAQGFLEDVKATKRRAAQRELKFWNGEPEELRHVQKVEDLNNMDRKLVPTMDPGEKASSPEFPTVLLSHVPLYRQPGTPCGPMREHWPPTKPPKGQSGPVDPDHRNAISVSAGYQYQNVLDERDTQRLIKSIGDVKFAFSGDDHDYCEIVHPAFSGHSSIHEYTVKSFSMAMGIPTPGFQMVSMYNPVDAQGNPLPDNPNVTLQTHLCLLPPQLSTYMFYVIMGLFTLAACAVRAFLVPFLNLKPFALDPAHRAPSAVLPVFKPKVEADEDEDEVSYHLDATSAGSASSSLSGAGNSTRTRGASITMGPSSGPKGGKWGGGGDNARSSGGPRIEIRRDTTYNNGKLDTGSGISSIGVGSGSGSGSSSWRPAARAVPTLHVVGREMWTTSWRTVWMAVLFWIYLTWSG